MAACQFVNTGCGYIGEIIVGHPTPPSCSTTQIWYDVSRNYRHARGFLVGSVFSIEVASNALPRTWTGHATPISGTWGKGKFQDGRAVDAIGLFYGNGTTSYYAETTDEGGSFGSVTTIGAGTVGDFDVVNGIKFFYRRKASGVIAVLVLDAFGNTAFPDTDTNITADDAPFSIRVVQVDGILHAGIQYRSGGTLTHANASDLITFS